MKKSKKNIKGIGQSGATSDIRLSYYNNYPDDEAEFSIVNEEEERKNKKRRVTKITTFILLGVLAIALVVGFFLIREFVIYPDFTKAAKNTVSMLAHDTEFDFSKLSREGQSKIEYSYDGTEISLWETHKGADLSKRVSVSDKGELHQYKQIVKGKEFAVEYDGAWYGASAKNAESSIAASNLPKLSSSEATYLLNYLNYVAHSSSADKDARITANFIKKVFSESSVSVCDSFRGVYGIFDIERYVKSRTYAVNNENLAELFDNIAEQLRSADITVQTAFRNWADINIFKGTKSFSEMLEEIEKHADDIRAKDQFSVILEICYTGQELSAILITADTKISDEDTERVNIVADFYYNGAKIRREQKTIKADESEENYTVSELSLTVQSNGSSAAIYRIHTDTDGVTTDIKLSLNNAENTFELTALCGENEAFSATGVYSDTKEQFDIKVTSVTRAGKLDEDIRFAATFYYKTTDIEMVAYKDILSMSEDELLALKDIAFDWKMKLPEDLDELNEEAKKFFGLEELMDKAREEPQKEQKAEAEGSGSEKK